MVLATEDGEAEDGLTLERPGTPFTLREMDNQPKEYQQQVRELTHRLRAAFSSEPVCNRTTYKPSTRNLQASLTSYLNWGSLSLPPALGPALLYLSQRKMDQ